MKVPVHKIVGDGCMTCKDGERLQREFREAFDRGDTVELDFDKTRIFVSAFFNAVVASLLESYSRSEEYVYRAESSRSRKPRPTRNPRRASPEARAETSRALR
jgi:hypothetical protein